MLRAKHQIAQGDHYGATRSLTILREECNNNNNTNNNNNNNNNNNKQEPHRQPLLPEVLRGKLEQWLVATVDALLLQVHGMV